MSDYFPQAQALLRAGRVDEAEAQCRKILTVEPSHAEALNLLGQIARKRGKHDEAIELIRRAISLRPRHAPFHHSLASVYGDLHQFDETIECRKSAQELQPDNLDANLHLGLAYQYAKRWSEAERVFRDVAERWPREPHGPQALGDCARHQGRNEEAAALYREALARSPNVGMVHLVLGTLLLTTGDLAGGEPHLRRAVELMPRTFPALLNLGSCLTRLKKEREALRFYKQALEINPNDVTLNVNVGLALIGFGSFQEAEKWFVNALRLDPNSVGGLCGLGVVFRETQRPEEAIEQYERALKIDPGSDAYRGLADALWDVGEIERAERMLREACERHPADPEAHSRLGTILTAEGDFEGAEAKLHAALKLDPYFPQALTDLARLQGRKLTADKRAAMDEALRRPASMDAHAGLHFGIAQVEDAHDNFALAAEHLRQANALSKAHWQSMGRSYDARAMTGDLQKALAIFDSECFNRTEGFGDPTEELVFVVGMQRSGTSLVEQILASHPRVFGIGESKTVSQSLVRLPSVMGTNRDPIDCLNDLTPVVVRDCAAWCLGRLRRFVKRPYDRIVDKTPNNYLFLGWLHLLFPNAKFIHCRRDLRDVALSLWMTHFSNIRWASDLDHITNQIRDYRVTMDHWRQVLPDLFLDVDYEILVANQERESRRLIDWVGLKWDPACLEFHQTKRPVRTASVTQVRKPMYSRSIGRWRNYVDVLRPLIEELGLGFD